MRGFIPNTEDLLDDMAGVFRWKPDGSVWAARAAGSTTHGFGPTPKLAMEAALKAAEKEEVGKKPRTRERLL